MDEKIIAFLRERQHDFVSGEQMRRGLGISRAGIWKHIEKLRREGYDIEASPHLGYRFVSAPDRLIASEVSWNLKTKTFGRKIYSFKKTDSTNTAAYSLAEDGEREGAVVFAESQAKGRGRLGRVWKSPAEGIYMSCILRPNLEPHKTARITLTAAVAVAEAIRDITALPALIKWPNDVMINGSKVSGILTEMKAEQDSIDFVIVGIGVNVNSAKEELPDNATSLKEEFGRPLAKTEVARKILELLESRYVKIRDHFDEIINEWRAISYTLGTRVRVNTHNEVLEGQALDIDENGGLIIRLDSGFNRHIFAGDVELVR